MAIYDEKINRNTDWGGDATTGYLPVSGRRVQEFIKDEFKEKIGKIYRAENGTCYCFANDDTYNEWRYSGGSDDLVIDSFLIEAAYNIELSAVSKYNSSVLKGSTGNTLEFNFKILDKKTGVAADSKARVSFVFTNGSIVKSFEKEYAVSNDWTNVNEVIDEYLLDGTNTISVKIEGLSTMASSQAVFTYSMFDLRYEPSFGYNKVQTGNTIEIPYIVECAEVKFLEFYLDGELVETTPVVSPRQESSQYINIASLDVGQHSLQTRAYIQAAAGSKFYSEFFFYNFAKAGQSDPALLMGIKLPASTEVSEGKYLKLSTTQFESVTFDWSVYDYLTRTLNVTFQLGDNVITTVQVSTVETDLQTFTFRPMLAGDGQELKIYSKDSHGQTIFEYGLSLDVAESSSGIKETTDGMTLKLSAMGRRNTASDRDKWEYTNVMGDTYKTTFNGFAWNSQQGWNEESEALILSDGACIEIDLKPMFEDWAERGGTLEMDFETFDSEDDNAPVMIIRDSGEEGAASIKITATDMSFETRDKINISTRYKDNDRIKVAFIGNKNATTGDGNLIYIVVNGVLERAALYAANDSMFSNQTIKIGNPDGKVKCRLHSIRAYNRAITVDEAFNNFVVDSDDVQRVYEENNILRDGTSDIDFEKIANKIPVMIFTGDMPEIYENGIDKKWRYFDVEYINRADQNTYNFVSFNCQMKLQGTSSLEYPRKNFKLKTKNKEGKQEEFDKLTVEYDPIAKRLRDKRTGNYLDINESHRMFGTACWTFDNTGKVLKKGKYVFKAGAHKTDKWTLKADYMESSCSHNVGAGKSWNDIFRDVQLTLGTEAGYQNLTYKDSAIVWPRTHKYDKTAPDGTVYHYIIDETKVSGQKGYLCRTEAQKVAAANPDVGEVRTAVDGFPMVCYYRLSHESNELIFMGQYNFLNDKGTQEIYGFEDIADPTDETETNMIFDGTEVEVWEGLKNTHPLSLFKTTDNFMATYEETWASRWPDPDDKGDETKRQVNPTALKELCEWLVSTRHEDDTVYDSTLNIDSSFAERINSYQYGYSQDTEGHVAESYVYASGTSLEDNAENRQKKFETEKWEHFDVWKLAGYYIYLMRYGAVDQFVKNTMLTTEGNGKYDPRTDSKYRKWYYINYDNDCLFGLRNNGVIAFDWTLDRQTKDEGAVTESGETSGNTYAMMGHDSTLWNNLEKDEEFMRMVRDLDDSMTHVGLTYDGMVKAFDTTQTDKWCERIYNANEKYKYIDAVKGRGDMSGNPVNNLWMLQGTRKSHRHWWIANHFNLLNAKWLSGDYKSTYCLIKTNAEGGDKFSMVAGADYYYAWGQRKGIYESNIVLKEGDSFDFVFPYKQVQGDPVVVYAVNKMSELDFSEVANSMDAGSFDFRIPNIDIQNTLKRLIIGNPDVVNTKVTDENTGTWGILTGLEYLDVTNYYNFKNLSIAPYKNLHTFKAKGTQLSSFAPAEGTRFDLIELPATISTFDLKKVKFDWTNLNFNFTSALNNLYLEDTILGSDYFTMAIKPWLQALNGLSNKEEKLRNKEIKLRNVKWDLTSLDDLWLFECLRKYSSKHVDSLNITGEISLYNVQGGFRNEDIARIQALLGEHCFEEGNAIYVKAPQSIFIYCDKEENMVAGDTAIFSSRVYPTDVPGQVVTYTLVEQYTDEETGDIKYRPISGDQKYNAVLINKKDASGKAIGELHTTEMLERTTGLTLTVECRFEYIGMNDKTDYYTLDILEPTYPDHAEMTGESSIRKDEGERERVYTVIAKTSAGKEAIGSYDIDWVIDGEGMRYLASYAVMAKDTFKIIMKSDEEPEISAPITIKATITPAIGEPFTVEKDILVLNSNVIITRETNPVVFGVCRAKGWINTSADAVLKSDVAAVTDEMFGTSFDGSLTSPVYTFDELQYFTGLTTIPDNAFMGGHVSSVKIPDNVKTLGNNCFKNCAGLVNVEFIGESEIEIIPEGAFCGCNTLQGMALPSTVTEIKAMAFGNTAIRNVLTAGTKNDGLILSEVITTMHTCCFETGSTWNKDKYSNKVEIFEIPANLITLPVDMLKGYSMKEYRVNPGNMNFTAIDGVLYNASKQNLLSYPANRPGSTYVVTTNVTESFGNYAFYGARNLVDFVMPTVTSSYGEHLFEDSQIGRIIIPSGAMGIALSPYMFCGCEGLSEVVVESNAIGSIGAHCFDRCKSLLSFSVPVSVDTIGTYAFSQCDALTALTFTDNVKTVGNNVVDNCPSLTDLVMPRFISTTTKSCVSSCEGLTGLTLPLFIYDKETEEGVVEIIVNETFGINELQRASFINSCNNIEEIRLAEGDKGTLFKIYDNALYKINGENLTFVYIPWGKTSLMMPENVTIIGGGSLSQYPGYEGPKLITLKASPHITSIQNQAAIFNKKLSKVTFYQIDNIAGQAFNTTHFSAMTIYNMTDVPVIVSSTFGSSELKDIYVPYNMITKYEADSVWSLPSYNFNWKPILLSGEHYVKVMRNGEEVTGGTTTLKPRVTGGEILGTYVEGRGYRFIFSEAVNTVMYNESCILDCGDAGIGTITFNVPDKTEYEINISPMVMASNKSSNETVTITSKEYQTLMAKLNDMEARLSNL